MNVYYGVSEPRGCIATIQYMYNESKVTIQCYALHKMSDKVLLVSHYIKRQLNIIDQ